jgi:hypothetical protein
MLKKRINKTGFTGSSTVLLSIRQQRHCNHSDTTDSDIFRNTFFFKYHTDKKENQIFLIYKEIQNGAVAKSYMGKYLRISLYIR